eukprot:Awhi_evm1s3417
MSDRGSSIKASKEFGEHEKGDIRQFIETGVVVSKIIFTSLLEECQQFDVTQDLINMIKNQTFGSLLALNEIF